MEKSGLDQNFSLCACFLSYIKRFKGKDTSPYGLKESSQFCIQDHAILLFYIVRPDSITLEAVVHFFSKATSVFK